MNLDPTTGSTVTVKGDVSYNSSTDKLELYNGAADPMVQEAKAANLTNKSIDSDSNTLTNIANASIKAAAAIALNKLAATTASRALVSDGSGFVSPATTTSTEIGYVNGVTSAIQTQLNGKIANTLTSTTGDMIYASSADTPARLAIGSANQVLKTVNGIPSWATQSNNGINYLVANPDAEVGTSGWATYADAAQNIPVDGTGGSPSSTWTRSTSSPLRGSGSFLWTRTANNRQGEGVSYDFTIDSADQAKPLAVTGDCSVASGTFFAADGITAPLNDGTTSQNAGMSDLEFFMYDVTNAVLIPISPQVLVGSSSNSFTFKGTFQTASNSTSYRLIIHTARSTAVAFTMKFDNFFVGSQAVSYGAPIDDLKTYTPTFSGIGTPSGVTVQSRRVGDCLEIFGKLTTGTVSGSQMQISMGYNGVSGNVTSDSSISGNTQVGWATGYNGTLDNITTLAAPSLTYLVFGQKDGSNGGNDARSGTQIFASNNNQGFSFYAKVKISGWSSTVLMSNDTDTRVVSMVATSTNANSINNNTWTGISTWTTVKDTHGAFDGTTYTVPVSGDYIVSGAISFAANSTGARGVRIVVGGVTKYESLLNNIGASLASSTPFSVLLPKLTAGNTITISGYQNSGGALLLFADATYNYWSINRISGPSAIASTEDVNARASASSTTINNTTVLIINPTLTYDSHGAYSTSTGRYTCPTSGKYRVTAAMRFGNQTWTAGNQIELYVYKNAAQYSTIGRVVVNTNGSYQLSANGADTVSCVAGDILDVRGYSDVSTALNGATQTYIAIEKAGK